MTTRKPYRLSDFDFDLPSELVAQVPAPERSGSRLLHVAGARLVDLAFGVLPDLLVPGDLLVFNDTRVVRSRIAGRKPSGGRVELMLERIVAPCEAWMQLRASHPPRAGGRIDLPGGASATVCERDQRFFRLIFDVPTTLAAYLDQHGAVPLPPYIARAPEPADAERYQTVYARHPGAVAAPTAGLHFDDALLAALRDRGRRASLTLRCTSAPARSCRWKATTFAASDAQRALQRSAGDIGRDRATPQPGPRRRRRRHDVAARAGGRRGRGAGRRRDEAETSLFITPGFRFRVVDRLLTNFHLPRSTLLMLVSAFAGYDAIRAAYAHAIAARYRFFSYGDAMLLERDPDADA